MQREWVEWFRCTKDDFLRLVPVLGWPQALKHTKRNRYSVTPLLATCVVLQRLASPIRWATVQTLYGKHSPQLSEIFWEAIEQLLELRLHLITEMNTGFIQSRLQYYASCIFDKCGGLQNCIGFIDGTNLYIARPSLYLCQLVFYNGHKRRHAVKFQAITAADGSVLHAGGPIEGRRHDWTLYIRSGVDELLSQILNYNGVQYCIYGDPAYNERLYLRVPFAGTALSAAQRMFNKAMAAARITVEWFFRELKQYWGTMDYQRKLIIKQSPIASLYLASMLLTNFYNGFYQNRISQYFDCLPPSLEDYVNQTVQPP